MADIQSVFQRHDNKATGTNYGHPVLAVRITEVNLPQIANLLGGRVGYRHVRGGSMINYAIMELDENDSWSPAGEVGEWLIDYGNDLYLFETHRRFSERYDLTPSTGRI